LARVPSPWIVQQAERVPDLDAFIARLRAAADEWPMTVGWIDTTASGAALGRGALMCGRWAEAGEGEAACPPLRPAIQVPVDLPGGILNRSTLHAMNAAYFRNAPATVTRSVVSPEAFFYPLDRIGSWNRGYGRGFIQHQAVFPHATAGTAVRQILECLARHYRASFVSVIKDCGPEGIGALSFPMPGITLALDIPHDALTQALVDALNRIVINYGGRIYLAKDALTRADDFRAMEPRLDPFLTIRRQWDPTGRIRSAQSVRLFGW
jgi:FAD/FMN-containing dehydrogenase